MENARMGKVLVSAKIENIMDLYAASRAQLDDGEVRRVEVADALVDSGAFGLLMPMHFINQLGLKPVKTRISRTVGGDIPIPTYEVVRLTVQGRDCSMEVSGIADHLPVIIGQLPLEAMDWVIDMKGQKLIGNPEHGGVEMVDIL